MSLKPTAPLDASAAQRHAAWGDAVSTVTQVLTSGVGCDARSFQPLVDVASRRGPSVDGALTVEWVVAPDAARCGVTVFQHGSGRDPLDAGRVLSAERFDAAALDAWDALAEALAGLDVASHVGLAWDRQRGFRLKLFVSGEADLAAAARIVGVTPGPGLVGVGCDFWDGGRYRPRRYFVGRSFADLAAQRGADATLPEGLAPVPPDGHAVLTLTQPTTRSERRPPGASSFLRAFPSRRSRRASPRAPRSRSRTSPHRSPHFRSAPRRSSSTCTTTDARRRSCWSRWGRATPVRAAERRALADSPRAGYPRACPTHP